MVGRVLDLSAARWNVPVSEQRAGSRDLGRMTGVPPLVTLGPSHLYRYWDRNWVLLYIGITHDPYQRMVGHSTSAPWWRYAYYYHQTAVPIPRGEISRQERWEIETGRAVFNRQHSPPWAAPIEWAYLNRMHTVGIRCRADGEPGDIVVTCSLCPGWEHIAYSEEQAKRWADDHTGIRGEEFKRRYDEIGHIVMCRCETGYRRCLMLGGCIEWNTPPSF